MGTKRLTGGPQLYVQDLLLAEGACEVDTGGLGDEDAIEGAEQEATCV